MNEDGERIVVENERSITLIAIAANVEIFIFSVISSMKMASLSYDNVLFPNLYALTALLPFFLAHFLTISILYYNAMPNGEHRIILPIIASVCIFFVTTNIIALAALAAAIWIPYVSIKPRGTGSKAGQIALIIVMCGFLLYLLISPPYDWYEQPRHVVEENLQEEYDSFVSKLKTGSSSSVYIRGSERQSEILEYTSEQVVLFSYSITEEALEPIADILSNAILAEYDETQRDTTESAIMRTFTLSYQNERISFVYYLDNESSDEPKGFTRINFVKNEKWKYLGLENKHIEELFELLEEYKDDR